jgi:hypothetical protein
MDVRLADRGELVHVSRWLGDEPVVSSVAALMILGKMVCVLEGS